MAAAALTKYGRNTIVFLSILTLLATVVVLLRLVRKKTRRALDWDDWLLLVALVLLYEQDVWIFIFAVLGGEGRTIYHLTESEQEWSLRAYYFSELSYVLLVTTTRLSVLLSYKKLLWHIQWCTYAIYVLATICLLWFLASFLSFLLQCSSIQSNFTPRESGLLPQNRTSCFDVGSWLDSTAVSNTFIDWSVLLLPIQPLFSVMSRLDGIEAGLVFASFGTGLVACVASTAHAVLNNATLDDDFTMKRFLAVLSTHTEPVIGIIGASLPFLTLGHYFKKAHLGLQRILGRRHKLPSKSEDTLEPSISVVEISAIQKPATTKPAWNV